MIFEIRNHFGNEQAVKKKYRAMRYKILWTCEAALPTYRYPTPFAVPNQGWSVIEEDERPRAAQILGAVYAARRSGRGSSTAMPDS